MFSCGWTQMEAQGIFLHCSSTLSFEAGSSTDFINMINLPHQPALAEPPPLPSRLELQAGCHGHSAFTRVLGVLAFYLRSGCCNQRVISAAPHSAFWIRVSVTWSRLGCWPGSSRDLPTSISAALRVQAHSNTLDCAGFH